MVFFYRFYLIFEWFFDERRKPNPRSTREFSSGSQVAAFASRRKIYWKLLKNILKIHCKIYEKSMKKRVDFWADLLIDFWKVFGRVLGAILASKSMQKSIKKSSKNLIDFLMGFWAKMPLKWEARGGPKSAYSVDISRSWSRDPSGEANLTKMESNWSQNDTNMEIKLSQNDIKN